MNWTQAKWIKVELMLRNNKNVSNLLSLSDVYNPVWLLEFGLLHVNKSNDLMYLVS